MEAKSQVYEKILKSYNRVQNNQGLLSIGYNGKIDGTWFGV